MAETVASPAPVRHERWEDFPQNVEDVLYIYSQVMPLKNFSARYVGRVDRSAGWKNWNEPTADALLRDLAKERDCDWRKTRNMMVVYPRKEFHFFKAKDGREFAEIIGLRPGGILAARDVMEWVSTGGVWMDLFDSKKQLKPGGGEFVPYSQLPDEIRQRYENDGPELAAAIKGGIDGTYTFRKGIIAFSGAEIDLKDGMCLLGGWSDTPKPSDKPVAARKYTLEGHWIVPENATAESDQMILVLIKGRLAIMDDSEYLDWKDYGIVSDDVLYRREDAN